MSREGRPRWTALVAPLACLAVAAGAWMLGQSAMRAPATGGVAGAEGDGGADVVRLLDAPAGQSSSATFLDDVACEAAAVASVSDGADAAAAVTWTEPTGLVDVARDVLTAYRDLGTAVLMTSGYLDIQGNVWAALLRGDDGWADIVLVATADDAESEVRVVRLALRDGLE